MTQCFGGFGIFFIPLQAILFGGYRISVIGSRGADIGYRV